MSLPNVKGQAVLDHTFPGEYINSSPVLLTTLGWVYPTIMYNSNVTLKLYGPDYTLLKSIYLSIPGGYQYLGIYNISDNLFNTDNKVEVLYSMYNSQVHHYDMMLTNETGQLLQEFPNCFFAIIYQLNGLFKMYMNNDVDSTASVYTLPGTMLAFGNPATPGTNSYVSPDPCSSFAQFHYTLPAGTSSALLEVFSTRGSKVIQKMVTPSGEDQIDVSSFPAGEYLYSIKGSGGIIAGGKFVRK